MGFDFTSGSGGGAKSTVIYVGSSYTHQNGNNIDFDSVLIDQLNAADVSNNKINVPKDGVYHVMGQVTSAATSSQNGFDMRVGGFNNATDLGYIASRNEGTTDASNNRTYTVEKTQKLEVSDVKLEFTPGENVTIRANSEKTFLELTQL